MKYLFLAITKVLIFGDFPKYSLAFFRARNYAFESNAKVEKDINQLNIIIAVH